MYIKLDKDWRAKTVQESAFRWESEEEIVFDGNNYIVDGKGKIAHLMIIRDCKNVIIRNTKFVNGTTEILKYIPRNQIQFPENKISIFEFLDGGAVLITGASQVLFEHCHFENNHSVMCGGAISNQSTLPVTIRNCTFKSNTAGHTGSAIDNLTPEAQLEVSRSTFSANKSNTWHMLGAPHGQISIFPKTSATIIDSTFSKGSFPIDYAQSAQVSLKGNVYQGFGDWKPSLKYPSKSSITDFLRLIRKLYWVIPKTVGKVFYGLR